MPFALAGRTPFEACRVLIEHSALTMAELRALEAAAAGAPDVLTLLAVSRRQAQSMLARWRGPIDGLRLLPLRHWASPAIVRGGAPLDAGLRVRLGREVFDRLDAGEVSSW